MHQDLKAETTRPPAKTLGEQQILFDDFVEEYNTVRPHEGIGQRRPSSLWTPSRRPYPEHLNDPEYPGYFEVRRVRHNGDIKFQGERCFVSMALAGQLIGLEPVEDGIWSLVFHKTLLGRLSEKTRRIYG
jgi:hypothetical protein